MTRVHGLYLQLYALELPVNGSIVSVQYAGMFLNILHNPLNYEWYHLFHSLSKGYPVT